MSSSLKISNLTVGYTEPLIQDINLDIRLGEIYPIIGANGSGKTTFLKTISGFIPPLEGSVHYEKPLNNLSIADRSKEFAISFEGIVPPFKITVQELLTQSCSLPLDRRVLENMEITELMKLNYQAISSGQKQRINVARALLQNTPYVFLDEPTSALDPPHKMEVMIYLRDYCRENHKGILLSVHDVQMALEVYDQFILLIDDSLVLKTKNEILTENLLSRVFPSTRIRFDHSLNQFKIV